MSSYNLNEKVGQDYFQIELDGFYYKMAYPTSEDVLQLTEVAEKGEEWKVKIKELTESLQTVPDDKKPEVEAQLKEYTANAKLAQQTFLDWCMSYVTPEMETAPELKPALMKKNVKYLAAFVNIVQTELQDS